MKLFLIILIVFSRCSIRQIEEKPTQALQISKISTVSPLLNKTLTSSFPVLIRTPYLKFLSVINREYISKIKAK